MSDAFILPSWKASERISSYCTTRHGGVSKAPFNGLNLGSHVGDEPGSVQYNREWVESGLNLPGSPCWLNQVHGADMVRIRADSPSDQVTADGAYTDEAGKVLVIMVADCLPILLASADGREIAAVHAGWKGLAAGVIKAALACFSGMSPVSAWLGPCISARHYEVGEDVRGCFTGREGGCFQPGRSQSRWWLDMPALASIQLTGAGVREIAVSGLCTYADSTRFYSYRREGKTGRIGVFIWINDPVQCG